MSNTTGDSRLKKIICGIRQIIENITSIENFPYSKTYCLTSDKIPRLESEDKLTPNSPSHKNPNFSFKNTLLISRKKQRPKVYRSSRKNVKGYNQKSYRVKSKPFHKKRHVISELDEVVTDDEKFVESKQSDPILMRIGHIGVNYRDPQKFINGSSPNDKWWITQK